MTKLESFFFLRKSQRLGYSGNFISAKNFFCDSFFYTNKKSPSSSTLFAFQKNKLILNSQNLFLLKERLPVFLSVFQKILQKKILFFHKIALLYFLEPFKNSFKIFKSVQTLKFFQFVDISFPLVFKKNCNILINILKKMNIFNKIQLTNLQNSFFYKKTKIQKLFLSMFLSRDKKNSLNYEENNIFLLQIFLEVQFCVFSQFKKFQNIHKRNNNAICKFENKIFERIQKLFVLKKRSFSKKIYNLLFLMFNNFCFQNFLFSPEKIEPNNFYSCFPGKTQSLNGSKFKNVFYFQKFLRLSKFSDFIKNYQQIQNQNSLILTNKIFQIFFEYVGTFNFLNLLIDSSQTPNNFQMIFHQHLKFAFCVFHAKIQTNQNFLCQPILLCSKLFSSLTKNPSCVFQKAGLHLIQNVFKKNFFLQSQKKFQTCFPVVASNENKIQSQKLFFDSKKTKSNFYLTLTFLNFEKNLFHTFQQVEKKQRTKVEFTFVKKAKRFCFQKFCFFNSFNKNFSSLFLIVQSYFSNFVFFNSTLLIFLKNSLFFERFEESVFHTKFFCLQQKNQLLKTNTNLLKNFRSFFENFGFKIHQDTFVSDASKKYSETSNKNLTKNYQFFLFRKKLKQNPIFVSGFKHFYSQILKNQEQMKNLLFFQNNSWLLSNKFVFLQTKIGKLQLFHFFPLFSCFLGINKTNFALFFDPFEYFFQSLLKNLFFQQSRKKNYLIQQSKIYLCIKQSFTYLSKEKVSYNNKIFEKHKVRAKTCFCFKEKINLYLQKKFENFIFANRCFQTLNFDGFSLSLILNYEKQLKNFYIFEKNPTREQINTHLSECKQILKKSIGHTQISFMKKLHKKIQIWCKKYNDLSKREIFDYCDSTLLKFLWNWARKTHPNKSKLWIRKKYFHLIHSNQWFFGKKTGNIFLCLPLHSQTKITKKQIF